MTNTYLVNEERLFVIDPGSESNVRLLCRYVQHILRRPIHDIDLIVLTHWNLDQGTAAEALQNVCHAPIAASAGVQQLLAEQRERKSASSLSHTTKKLLPEPPQHLDRCQPDYKHQAQQATIWLHDIERLPSHPDWRVIASPGHTPESLCLYNPFTREMLCGETVITIRGGTPVVRGSRNPVQLEETIRTLRSLPVSYLYPSHGRAILSHHPLSKLDVEW
jgi:glyoxylase-like metal-dependent hydrolase (beta-lactamase superfamily II)